MNSSEQHAHRRRMALVVAFVAIGGVLDPDLHGFTEELASRTLVVLLVEVAVFAFYGNELRNKWSTLDWQPIDREIQTQIRQAFIESGSTERHQDRAGLGTVLNDPQRVSRLFFRLIDNDASQREKATIVRESGARITLLADIQVAALAMIIAHLVFALAGDSIIDRVLWIPPLVLLWAYLDGVQLPKMVAAHVAAVEQQLRYVKEHQSDELRKAVLGQLSEHTDNRAKPGS